MCNNEEFIDPDSGVVYNKFWKYLHFRSGETGPLSYKSIMDKQIWPILGSHKPM